MDFMFNTTTTPNSGHKSEIKKTQNGVKKERNTHFAKNNKSNNESQFNFQFTNKNKVKAIVARKRPQKIINNHNQNSKVEDLKKVNSPPPKNYVMRPISPIEEHEENQNFPKKNYVIRPKDDDDVEDYTETTNKAKMDICLNVYSSNEPIKKNKPAKLNQSQRINKKQEKFSLKTKKNFDKVLTDVEINDGIKKFSKLPVRKNKQKKKNICDNIETKIIGQRFVKPIVEKVFTGCSLETLNVHPHLVKDLKDLLNITELTTVQKKVIPKALEGHDLLVRSQTGSGKTLAYALPMVQKLQEIQPKLTRNAGIMALIIVPTRELAIQTYEFLIKLLKPFTWIVPGYLCGGENRKSEKARLRKGINILVGTSGRILDHILHTDSCKLDKLRFLILDEADRMLELGYERDIKKIEHIIEDHKRNAKVADEFRPLQDSSDNIEEYQLQRLFLSATLTSAIQKLASLTLKDPIFIDNSDDSQINNEHLTDEYEGAINKAIKEANVILPENLELSYVVVHPKLRLVTLSGLLAKEFQKRKSKVLVFLATTEMVNFLHDLLNEALTARVLDEEDELNESEDEDNPLLVGVKFFKLHGSLTQLERGAVFKAFRSCSSGILLTTDVAGRGIDVPEVDLVIQYSPPQSLSDFVHRVGRTARVGRNGKANLFLASEEVEFIKILEDKRIRIKQEILEHILKNLKDVDYEANTVQEAASNLQHKFEELIEDDKELYEKGCKAYSSWVRNYAAFPKEIKHIFNIKRAHMGHYAKSFALKEPPSKFVSKSFQEKSSLPFNRLTYSERDESETTKLKNNENNENNKRKHNLSTKVSDGSRIINTNDKPNFSQRNGNPFKSKKISTAKNKLAEYSKNSLAMSVSEYDSGIPAKKRKFQ